MSSFTQLPLDLRWGLRKESGVVASNLGIVPPAVPVRLSPTPGRSEVLPKVLWESWVGPAKVLTASTCGPPEYSRA